MDFNNFFQIGPVPLDSMTGHYTMSLVALSYFMACLASYVALDIAGRIRTSGEASGSQIGMLLGGAVAMGSGIWTMHFIGMLAFVMPMPMSFDTLTTIVSMVFAIIASAFAFYLIKDDRAKGLPMIIGGIFLGLGIVTMHYIGMSAMLNMSIRYYPGLFILSIIIAIVTSEVALWLMIKSTEITGRFHNIMKIGSSLVMGLAICGMHYTGMDAAVFIDTMPMMNNMHSEPDLNPNSLSLYLAATTIMIIIIALIASRTWMNTLQAKNNKLLETEAILEKKSMELQKMVEQSTLREEKISAILTAAADGIVVIDDFGNIELCNRAVKEMLGYQDSELISKNIASFVGIFNTQEKKFLPITFEDLVKKRVKLREFAALCKNGSIVPLELTIARSTIHDINLYVLVLHDITERKRSQEELVLLNKQLVEAARKAGMAEVAIGVLHNIGNVLNSVNITSQTLMQRSRNSKVPSLLKLSDLLLEQKDHLDQFIKNDPRGQLLPQYLQQFAKYWNEEQNHIDKELDSLNAKILHIKHIVIMQQTLSKSTGIIETVNVNQLIEDALSLHSDTMEKHEVEVVREFLDFPPINIDKNKIMQILVNLIKNAFESVIESNKAEKKIILRTKMIDDFHIQIEIADNGTGIEQENLTNIFSYGFSTKKIGHGYGLHTSAVAAQQEGGSLKAYSSGRNQGATFVLVLPKEKESSSQEVLIGGTHA